MNIRLCFASVLLFAIALIAAAPVAAQADWNQWRGPKMDSIAEGETIVGTLDETTRLWRTEMPGPAGSSPIVVGDRVFVTSVKGDDLLLLCLDTTTGEQRWSKKVAGKNKKRGDSSNSASNSPCSDGKHVWTMFGNGQITCFTVKGEQVWAKNLQDEYGKFNIMFGMATTPVLHEGQLILSLIHGNMKDKRGSVGKIISLDAATGDEKWVHLRKTDATNENKHVYTSPIVAEIGGESQLIVHGADYTTGHQLDGGEELWRLGGMNPKGDNYMPTLRFVSSPVAAGGTIVVPSAKRRAIWAFKPTSTGSLTEENIAWKNRKATPDVASPVVYKELVFLARENGTMLSLDLNTGETLTEKRMLSSKHRSTPVVVDGKLIVVGRKGNLLMLEANANLDPISAMDLKEETTASPAFSNGRLFVRTFEALYAFGEKQ